MRKNRIIIAVIALTVYHGCMIGMEALKKKQREIAEVLPVVEARPVFDFNKSVYGWSIPASSGGYSSSLFNKSTYGAVLGLFHFFWNRSDPSCHEVVNAPCIPFFNYALHLPGLIVVDINSGMPEVDALINAFRSMDTTIREKVSSSAEQSQYQLLSSEVGFTALVAVIENGKIVIANAGDSRAVLVRSDHSVIQLSTDHVREPEIARIQAKQGADKLPVTRLLGYPSRSPSITSIPDVKDRPLQKGDEFLILATYGIWEKVSNKTAAIIIRDAFIYTAGPLNKNEYCMEAAKALKKAAVKAGADDDNIVIIVDLRPLTPKS